MKSEDGRLWYSPTDVAGFMACGYVSRLDHQALESGSQPIFRDNPVLDLLTELGKEHEARYLRHLQESGKKVVHLAGERSPQLTRQAMKEGADVIYQAPLEAAPFRGVADFLIKTEGTSQWGDWCYEVADTKLTHHTKAGSILQLAMYTEMVAELQGTQPIQFHIVSPGTPFRIESLLVRNHDAYCRNAKARFLREAENQFFSSKYPAPCAHCDVCRWWSHCDRRLRSDDFLGFVAGIRKSQIVELQQNQITTLEQFALANQAHPGRPRRGSLEAMEVVHRQSKIQLRSRQSLQPEWEWKPLEAGRGFELLPEPNPGDIFFDIEGNPRASFQGLEYLLGVVELQGGSPVYRGIWSANRQEERANFGRFMEYLIERIQRFPKMFIYHYASYEPTALKRLALEYGIYEEELDAILRSERFVDLHAVVKQAVRASVESYSLKELEKFYRFQRKIPLAKARSALAAIERLIELDLGHDMPTVLRDEVERYNEDDCRSTLELRDWLESLRTLRYSDGQQTCRRELKQREGESPDSQPENAEVFQQLMHGLEDWPADSFDQSRYLMAHLLDYFRRETKVKWWEFFRLRDMQPDDLFSEKSAIASLIHVEQLPMAGKSVIPTHRYTYPEQEVSIRSGDKLWDTKGSQIGSCEAIDTVNRTIDIKKTMKTIDERPTELFAFKIIRPEPMPESLLDMAEQLLATMPERTTPRTACFDLLASRAPRLKTLTLPMKGEVTANAVKIARDLDESCLAIQGPPGSGKTTVGSQMIIALASEGYRIGICAVGHQVILHLLEEVLKRSDGATPVAHYFSDKSLVMPDGVQRAKDKPTATNLLRRGVVLGGTAWLWSDPELEQQLDFLFIDEAGQMSLAMALAAGRSARNIILLGDPQQLEQPQQGSHPGGSGVAALAHILQGQSTIPPDRGLFLDQTRRLHPEICRFTSEQYYDGRLQSLPGLEKQVIRDSVGKKRYGLEFVVSAHTGNEDRSLEEVEIVRKLVEEFLGGDYSWVQRNEQEQPLSINDILVVAPFNLQVDAIRQALPEGARVGTVDKFQGQEAPIVIYSLTSSSVEDAPRGISFLLSRSRMNVATSRAKCLAIVVGTESLVSATVQDAPGVQLANGLCRFRELAEGSRI